MLGIVKLPPPAWGGEVRERILEIICFTVPFIEELGTAWETCPAVGSKWGQQEEGPTITKSDNSLSPACPPGSC